MQYLNEADVTAVRQTDMPLQRTRTGYGSKLPTSWMIQLHKLYWHRVYVILWSNSGTAYIIVRGKKLYLGSFEPSQFA